MVLRFPTVLVVLGALVANAESPLPVAEPEFSPARLFARTAPKVFVVDAQVPDGVSHGSAVLVGRERVVTNHHVISGATEVRLRQGDESWTATVIASDAVRDLAILEVPGLKRPPVELRSSSTLVVGERVVALGAPRGFELTLSEGLISQLRNTQTKKSFEVQTTAAISPGSSGGGLFDSRGRLIGITTWTRTDAQSINFARPAEWVADLLSRGKVAAAPRDRVQREPTAQFSFTERPPLLSCEMARQTLFGQFSQGLEAVESKQVTGKIQVVDFDRQAPRIEPEVGEAHQVVLVDVDRRNSALEFRDVATRRVSYWFAADGDGYTLARLSQANFYGESRTLAVFGHCLPSTPKTPIVLTEVSRRPLVGPDPMVACRNGTGTACTEVAENEILLLGAEASFSSLESGCAAKHGESCAWLAVMQGFKGSDGDSRASFSTACSAGIESACSGNMLVGELARCRQGNGGACLAIARLSDISSRRSWTLPLLVRGCEAKHPPSCAELGFFYSEIADRPKAANALATACNLGAESACKAARLYK
jgi:S1-C subfamily serine protease